MHIKQPLNKIDNICSALTRKKVPYKMEVGSNTVYIRYGQTVLLFSDNFMNGRTLSFIKQVKSYASKLSIPNTGIGVQDVKYITFYGDMHTSKTYSNIVEIDINKAYLVAAKRFGYISDKIYQKALEGEKMDYLIALGSMAAKYELYEVDSNGNSLYSGKRVNERTRSYFFACCKEIDMMLGYLHEHFGDKILGYWVDAVFVDQNFASAVEEVIYSFGYECKRKEIGKAHLINKEGRRVLYMTEKGKTKNDAGRVKYFCL